MVFGDGVVAQYVAAHISAGPNEVDPLVVGIGTSLRYGRIGLPASIWLASAGQPEAMPYAQPAVIVFAVGAASAAVSVLLPEAGPIGALLPFAAVGLLLSMLGGYAEVLAAAASLWATVFALRGRWFPAVLVLSAAMLTRENAGAVLLGLLAWTLMQRRFRGALILTSSLIPVAAWHTIVALRYGHLPFLDPYLRVTTDTIGLPFVSVWQSLTQVPFKSAAIAGIHAMLAVVAFALWRSSSLGTIASASALQVLWAAPFAWHFIGDAMRVSMFLELFTMLALAKVVYRRRPLSTTPSSQSA